MAATQNKVLFDYDLSKAGYLALVKKYFDEGSTHSESTILRTICTLKSQVDTHLMKNYEVSYAFGREILMEKMIPPTEPVQVLSYEDVFDIFIKYHIGNSHRGGHQYLLQMENNFNCSYNYPRICLSLIVKSCNTCKAVPKPKTSNKVSLVFVTVMVQQNDTTNFRYILIYIDKATDFVVLRPIKQKSDMEVSMEIFKILTQFGPPQTLCLHGYNKDFNKRVGSILRKICPIFTFAIEYKSANFDPSAFVVDKLQQWMTKNNSEFWEIGCSVIQKELNMDVNNKLKFNLNITASNKGLTPNELFFGRFHAPKVASEYSKTKVLTKPYKTNQFRMETREKNKGFTPPLSNPETIANDDVVELRIPSPENFDLDLLSQFENSEISQEQHNPAVNDIPSVDGTNAIDNGIKREPNVVLDETNKLNEDKSERKRKQTAYPLIRCSKESHTGDSGLLLLDLECEDENEIQKKKKEKESFNERKMSLRRKKNDLNIEKSPEYKIEDEELIYDPNTMDLEDAKDPFEDLESPDSVDF